MQTASSAAGGEAGSEVGRSLSSREDGVQTGDTLPVVNLMADGISKPHTRERDTLHAAGVKWVSLPSASFGLEMLSNTSQTLAYRALGIIHDLEHMEVARGNSLDVEHTDDPAVASAEHPMRIGLALDYASSPSTSIVRHSPSGGAPTAGKIPLISRGARGVVIFSAAAAPHGATRGISICAQVAERLGAAHLALPTLLRGQLNLPQGPWGADHLSDGARDPSLSDAIRAGKLVSGAPALQAALLNRWVELLTPSEHSSTDQWRAPLEARAPAGPH